MFRENFERRGGDWCFVGKIKSPRLSLVEYIWLITIVDPFVNSIIWLYEYLYDCAWLYIRIFITWRRIFSQRILESNPPWNLFSTWNSTRSRSTCVSTESIPPSISERATHTCYERIFHIASVSCSAAYRNHKSIEMYNSWKFCDRKSVLENNLRETLRLSLLIFIYSFTSSYGAILHSCHELNLWKSSYLSKNPYNII